MHERSTSFVFGEGPIGDANFRLAERLEVEREYGLARYAGRQCLVFVYVFFFNLFILLFIMLPNILKIYITKIYFT